MSFQGGVTPQPPIFLKSALPPPKQFWGTRDLPQLITSVSMDLLHLRINRVYLDYIYGHFRTKMTHPGLRLHDIKNNCSFDINTFLFHSFQWVHLTYIE